MTVLSATNYADLCAKTANRPLGALGPQLGAALAEFLPPSEIDPPLRLPHFVAQVSHETGGFEFMHELGGPDYFAKYDGRRDLGNIQPGDGFRFRGRGLIQITGRANYQTYGEKLDIDLLGDPDLAAEPDVAVEIAARFWTDHGLNALADQDAIEPITRAINGGLNGLADREVALARAKAWMVVRAP